jgi:hypothetical protein
MDLNIIHFSVHYFSFEIFLLIFYYFILFISLLAGNTRWGCGCRKGLPTSWTLTFKEDPSGTYSGLNLIDAGDDTIVELSDSNLMELRRRLELTHLEPNKFVAHLLSFTLPRRTQTWPSSTMTIRWKSSLPSICMIS